MLQSSHSRQDGTFRDIFAPFSLPPSLYFFYIASSKNQRGDDITSCVKQFVSVEINHQSPKHQPYHQATMELMVSPKQMKNTAGVSTNCTTAWCSQTWCLVGPVLGETGVSWCPPAIDRVCHQRPILPHTGLIYNDSLPHLPDSLLQLFH